MKRHPVFLWAIAIAVTAFGLLFTEFSNAESAAELHDLGVVYLHGKGGWPGALNGGILSALKEEAAAVAREAVAGGFGRLKIKVGGPSTEEDEARVRAIAAAAPGAPLRLDGNQGFQPENALAWSVLLFTVARSDPKRAAEARARLLALRPPLRSGR